MATRGIEAPSPSWWAEQTDRLVRSVDNAEAKRFIDELMRRLWDSAECDQRAQLFNSLVPDRLSRNIDSGFTSDALTLGWLRCLFDDLSEEGRRVRIGGSTLQPKASTVIRDILLVASESGFHPDVPLFEWLGRNGPELAAVSIRRIGRIVGSVLASDSLPEFELMAEVLERSDGRRGNITTVWFDTESSFVRLLILDAIRESVFFKVKSSQVPWTEATAEFTKSLGFVPASLDDFTVETFSRQFQYLDAIGNRYKRGIALRMLVHTYAHIIRLLPDDQTQFTVRSGLTSEVLTRQDFTEQWRGGYRPYVHNLLDPAPRNPHWLLYPDKDELNHTCVAPASIKVDVSYGNDGLQRMLSSWLWQEVPRCEEIRSVHKRMKSLLDTLSMEEGADRPRATTAGVIGWMGNINSTFNDRSKRRYKKLASSLLDYGQREGYIRVEQSVWVFLSSKGSWASTEPETCAADPEQLRLLAEELDKRSGDSMVDWLASCAFATVALTKLRIGSILNLRVGDLVEDVPKHLHSVRVSTKTDGHGHQEVQITAKVYHLLRSLMEETDGIRRRAPDDVAEYLFIYETRSFGAVRRMGLCTFRNQLANACDAVGIDRIRPSDIRRRYQTEVVLRGIENNYSRLALKSLTGHSSLATTERYYIRGDQRQYLEATHGIEIGSMPIRGEIVQDDSLLEAEGVDLSLDAVEMGAGYCRNEECDIQGTSPCLMCDGFVTTPRCIPEFEEAVAGITRKIQRCASTPHDREHLIKAKQLYLEYLAAMYSMREGQE